MRPKNLPSEARVVSWAAFADDSPFANAPSYDQPSTISVVARSREPIWLAHVGVLGGAGGVLLGISAALAAATKGYSVWTSALAIVAYALFGLAVACLACAFYDVPIPLPRRARNAAGPAVLTAVHPQAARVGDRVTAYGNKLTKVRIAGSLQASVAGVNAEVLNPPAAAAGRSAVARAADQVTFLMPPLPVSVARAPGSRQQVSVITAAGLVASLPDALAVVPDEPVAVRLSPALIVVASAAEYADISIEITGQYLGTPGATTADTATAQVSIRGPDTAATTSAAYVDDHHVAFTLPTDTPIPSGAPLTFQVQLIRGANSTKPLTLTVKAAPAPDLNAINPDLIVADPGTSLAGQQIALTGGSLLPLAPPVGAPRNVAAQGADPLKVTVTDAAGASVGQLASQPRSANAAAVTLLAPLTIPQAGDSPVAIVLQRGSLSSGPQTLILRARYDPAMTVPPIATPAGTVLAGHQVTVRSDVFSVNLPAGQPGPLGRHVVAYQATLVAQVDAGGVALEVPDLPAVNDGQTDLTFTLPPDTPLMPAGGARWNIKVSREGHMIATGDLVLQNQSLPVSSGP
jgi:hypothetical protein